MKLGILLFCATWALAVPLCAAPPAFKHGERASVLIFTTTDCPIANAMLPEITRIEQEFSKQGVAFTLVQVDPDTNAAAVREHDKSYGISIPSVLDPKHELVRRYKATRTPEAFVIMPDGSIAYHGRINDLYHAPGQRRRAPAINDLRDALASVVSGKPVGKSYQPAIGCVITDFAR
jgi:hypothetical protein